MKVRVLLGMAVAAVLLVGCGGSSNSSSDTTAATTTAAAAATSAAKGTTINIDVGDTKGTNGPMTLKTSSATAPAGDVTFVVKNTGTIDHEVVVLKTDVAFDKIPVGSDNKISEDTSVGETGDPALKPGETRTFTLSLEAGTYALVCNIAKHYAMGMRAPFTVTP